MQVPSPSEYSEVRFFLKELIQVNKSKNYRHGVRYFAGKLKWPASYINAVVLGKRKLTIRKALELSEFCRFGEYELEQLLIITIKGNVKKGDRRHSIDAAECPPDPNAPWEVETAALFEYLQGCTAPPNSKQIQSEMRIFKNWSLAEIDTCLHEVKSTYFSQQPVKDVATASIIVEKKMEADARTRQILDRYLHVGRDLNTFEDIVQFQAGYAWLDDDQYKEYAKRMRGLTGWLIKNSSLEEPFTKEKRLFQLTSFMLPVTKKP